MNTKEVFVLVSMYLYEVTGVWCGKLLCDYDEELELLRAGAVITCFNVSSLSF